MLDLETLGTTPDSAILAIGAVIFDPLAKTFGPEFYQAIDLTSSSEFGRIDPETVKWWMKQSYEAKSVFSDRNAQTLEDALQLFSQFVAAHGGNELRIWGNGAGFDNVILAYAYRACKLALPWNFRFDRDVRTIVELGIEAMGINPKTNQAARGIAHNALDDAKFQAQYVSDIYCSLMQHQSHQR
jgi:exodeoxyribonuclease VIII